MKKVEWKTINTRIKRSWHVGLMLLALIIGSFPQISLAATPGLPFTEDFSDTTLLDQASTTAFRSPIDQALFLKWRQRTFDPFPNISGITTDNHVTYALAVGDLNGDGFPDLVAGNLNAPDRIYLNNGTSDPFFGVTGFDLSAEALSPDSIDIGDMDNDGDLDIIVGMSSGANRLYLNDGTGTTFIGSNLPTTTGKSLTVADMNGDGHLDIVSGYYGVDVLLNNGTSAPFAAVTPSTISYTITSWVAAIGLADMDGDGDIDIVTGSSNTTKPCRIYLNDGTGTAFVGSDIAALDAGFYTGDLSLADMDGDGDIDVVAGNYNLQTNRLYLNNGTSAPFSGVSGTDISLDARSTGTITTGDVDGDGDMDVLTGNGSTTQAVRLYLNNGTTTPFAGVTGSDVMPTVLFQTRKLVLADMTGDGRPDLLIGHSDTSNIIGVNGGTSDPFLNVIGSDISADADYTIAVAVGDLNGDGYADVINGTSLNTQANKYYLNNTTSNPFSSVVGQSLSVDTYSTQALAIGDLNGDGFPDVISGNYNQPDRIYFNNGTTNPFSGVTGIDLYAESLPTRSVEIADLDGDGDMDVVVGVNSGANRLYLNDGTGLAFVGSNLSSTTGYSLALADMNNDGLTDILSGYYGVTILFNNGTTDPFAGSASSTIPYIPLNTVRAIGVADMDGDGDLDVVTGNVNQNYVYLSSAGGTSFISEVIAPLDLHDTGGLALADMDGDGDIDIVSGNYNNNLNRLYLNNGTSSPFEGVTGSDITADAMTSYSIKVADMNHDGNMDVIAGVTNGTNRLYLNSIPQVSANSGTYGVSSSSVKSKRINTGTANVDRARLTPSGNFPPNTSVDYFLSNDSGLHYFHVKSGQYFTFPTSGIDLRWRAELHSLSPILSPRIDSVLIERNNVPTFTGTPIVSGTPAVNNVLSVINDASTDADGDSISTTYQWKVSNDNITFASLGGETNNTLLLTSLHAHKYIQCVITLSDGMGGITISTTPTVTINNTTPSFPSTPLAVGTAQVGQLLMTLNATAADVDGDIVSHSYEWMANGQLFGTNSPFAFLTAAEAHADIYARVTANDGRGGVVTVGTNVITMENSAPVALIGPSIDNLLPKSGDMITASIVTAYMLDADGDTLSYEYSWQANGVPITGADPYSGTLTLSDNELYKSISCILIVRDGYGGQTVVASINTTYPVQPAKMPTMIINEAVTVAGSSLGTSTITLGESVDVQGMLVTEPQPSIIGSALLSTPVDIQTALGTGLFASAQLTQTNSSGVYRSFNGGITPDAAGSWKIQAVYGGDTANVASSGAVHTLTVNKATPALNLTLDVTPVTSTTALNVVQGQTFQISGRLTPALAAGFGGGQTVDVVLTFNQASNVTLNLLTDGQGNFSGSYTIPAEVPNQPGVQVATLDVRASFAGDANYNSSLSPQARLTVTPPPTAYAVLVEGRISGDAGLVSHQKTMGKVYQTLLDRNVPTSHIRRFGFDTLAPGHTGLPTQAAIGTAITDMYTMMNANPGPLYIVFVNHGDPGVFHIYQNPTATVDENEITPLEVQGWLNALEANLTGLRSKTPVVFIDGSCFSGSFAADLGGANRTFISASAADEVSYMGARDPADGIREGEFFVSELFAGLAGGSSLGDAFDSAAAATSTLTYDPGNAFGVAHQDDARQHPQLDDNGDGVGSDAPLSTASGADGALARTIHLGWSDVTVQNHVEIVQVPSTLVVDASPTAQYDLYVTLSGANASHQVWMEVRAPGYQFANVSQNQQVDPNLKIALAANITDGTGQPTNRYLMGKTYTDTTSVLFDTPGRYELFFYARDGVSGHISTWRSTTVIVNDPTNTPPTMPVLQTPANGDTTVNTIALLDWQASSDADGDAIQYKLTLSTTQDFSGPVAVVDNLNSPFSLVDRKLIFNDGSRGLVDATTYYWKVMAIDSRGGTSESPAYSFTVNTNTNSSQAGYIVGAIVDTTTAQSITASITIPSGTYQTFSDGTFWIQTTAGSYTITISKAGYVSKSQNITVPPYDPILGSYASVGVGLTPMDTTPPVIALNGNNPMNIALGTPFSDPGATVTDNVDTGLTAGVSGSVNTSAIGSYVLTYTASDSAGNVATPVQRTVNVVDVTAPVVTPPQDITVITTSGIGVAATNAAISAFLTGASALDNVDGVVSVSNNAPGTFPVAATTVTFSATDVAGNTGTATANVTVLLDSDGDGVPDINDAFPNDARYTTDADSDGMADSWEMTYFGNLTTAGAGTDFNNDGTLDVVHFTNGTDPTAVVVSKTLLMESLGDINGNGFADFAVLGKKTSTNQYVIRVKDSITAVHLITEISLNTNYKPVQMVQLADMNANGSPELAVLEVDPVSGLNAQIQVKDSLTGASIVNIPVKSSVKPHMLIALGDVNGNGSSDLALSEVDATTGKNVQIQVKDGLTGAAIANVPVNLSVKPHMLVALGDVNGNGSSDLALSEVDAATGKNVQIQVKDGLTGAAIANVPVNLSVKPHMLVALGDVNGNGSSDLALSEVDATTGLNSQIQVKDSRTGGLISNINISNTVKPHMLVALGDVNGNGSADLALSEVDPVSGLNSQIQVKDGLSGALISNIKIDSTLKPHMLTVLPDVSGNGASELVLSEVDATTGKNVQVQVKDAQSGSLVVNIPVSVTDTPLALAVASDTNGNTTPEVGLLGIDTTGAVQIQVKDGLTGGLISNLAYPKL